MIVWLLKARFRFGGGYWVVEVFEDENLCRKELELMQKSFPNHEFWVENERIPAMSELPGSEAGQ